MRIEERVRRVFADLRRRYGDSFEDNPGTALARVKVETEDPFRVLISTILSQRTRDEKTEEASARLFAKYATPEAIARAPVRELRELIRPAGFYRQKAPKIREVSRILLADYGGRVPDTFDELVSLPQVGPKTANCVLVYGYGKPAIPVDVHVAVISRRLGLAPAGADEAEVERRHVDRGLRGGVPRQDAVHPVRHLPAPLEGEPLQGPGERLERRQDGLRRLPRDVVRARGAPALHAVRLEAHEDDVRDVRGVAGGHEHLLSRERLRVPLDPVDPQGRTGNARAALKGPVVARGSGGSTRRTP